MLSLIFFAFLAAAQLAFSLTLTFSPGNSIVYTNSVSITATSMNPSNSVTLYINDVEVANSMQSNTLTLTFSAFGSSCNKIGCTAGGVGTYVVNAISASNTLVEPLSFNTLSTDTISNTLAVSKAAPTISLVNFPSNFIYNGTIKNITANINSNMAQLQATLFVNNAPVLQNFYGTSYLGYKGGNALPSWQCSVVSHSSLSGDCSDVFPEYVANFKTAPSYNPSPPQVKAPYMGGTDNFTVSMWAYRFPILNGCSNLDSGYFSYVGVQVHFTSCDDLAFHSNLGYSFFNSVHPVQKEWQFFTIVYNYISGNVSVYINGTLAESNNVGQITFSNSQGLQIGLAIDTNSFNGTISNVQLYNSSLNSSEIDTLWKRGIGGTPVALSHLVGWYPLDGNGNDYSGNNNNANAINVTFVPVFGDTSIPSAGTYTIVANTLGNINYTSATTNTITLQISKATPGFYFEFSNNSKKIFLNSSGLSMSFNSFTPFSIISNLSTINHQLTATLFDNNALESNVITSNTLQFNSKNIASGIYSFTFNSIGNDNYTSFDPVFTINVISSIEPMLNISSSLNANYITVYNGSNIILSAYNLSNPGSISELLINGSRKNYSSGGDTYLNYTFAPGAGTYNVTAISISGTSITRLLIIKRANLSATVPESQSVSFYTTLSLNFDGQSTFKNQSAWYLYSNGNLYGESESTIIWNETEAPGAYTLIFKNPGGENYTPYSSSILINVEQIPTAGIISTSGPQQNIGKTNTTKNKTKGISNISVSNDNSSIALSANIVGSNMTIDLVRYGLVARISHDNYTKPGNVLIHISNITNITTLNIPSNYSKMLLLNISVIPETQFTLNLSLFYPGNQVTPPLPFEYVNGGWDPIHTYSINRSNNTLRINLIADPILGIFYIQPKNTSSSKNISSVGNVLNTSTLLSTTILISNTTPVKINTGSNAWVETAVILSVALVILASYLIYRKKR